MGGEKIAQGDWEMAPVLTGVLQSTTVTFGSFAMLAHV